MKTKEARLEQRAPAHEKHWVNTWSFLVTAAEIPLTGMRTIITTSPAITLGPRIWGEDLVREFIGSIGHLI